MHWAPAVRVVGGADQRTARPTVHQQFPFTQIDCSALFRPSASCPALHVARGDGESRTRPVMVLRGASWANRHAAVFQLSRQGLVQDLVKGRKGTAQPQLCANFRVRKPFSRAKSGWLFCCLDGWRCPGTSPPPRSHPDEDRLRGLNDTDLTRKDVCI